MCHPIKGISSIPSFKSPYGILFAWQEKEADVPGYYPTRLGWMVGTTEIFFIVTTTLSESRDIGFTVKESPLLAHNTVD
jgi:hypothetical protein